MQTWDGGYVTCRDPSAETKHVGSPDHGSSCLSDAASAYYGSKSPEGMNGNDLLPTPVSV